MIEAVKSKIIGELEKTAGSNYVSVNRADPLPVFTCLAGKLWKGIPGRLTKVKLGNTANSGGSGECKSIVYPKL